MAIPITTVLSMIVAILAAVVGIFISPIPKRLGFYQWMISKHMGWIGMSPAFHYGVPWKYTFEELYENGGNTLKEQTAIVTGANSGVGYETSLALGRLGASVTLACRNNQKCEKAAQAIRDDSRYAGGDISTMNVDTSSLASVKKFSEEYLRKNRGKPLDILYLNAGIAANNRGLSEDGIEMVFATNYVGHHLMYKLLEPLVLKSKMARVIQTSSAASFYPPLPHKVGTSLEVINDTDLSKGYKQSKLAQVLWVKELTRKLGPNSHVYVNAVHPGAVDTGIWETVNYIPKFMRDTLVQWLRDNTMWTPEQGALTMLYLGVATNQIVSKNIRGKYYHPQAQEVVNSFSIDEPLQKELWKFSDNLVSKFV